MNIDNIIITDRQTLQEMIGSAVEEALINHAEEFSNLIKEDETYTTKEIAKKLKVSTSTIAKYRERGDLDYVQNGKNIIYTRKHYLDFIKNNEIKS